jgi:ABC-2 type transport system ATP-binding protein
MVMNILAPDAGEVRLFGRPADQASRDRVGYLPEERGLFEDTPVIETLAYLGSLRGMTLAEGRAAAMPLLERLGLADRARDKVQALSKGNQQKVQIAAAVLHRPSLAVLDEPFSGLDPIHQELFSEMMKELRDGGTAVLLSAHHLDLVERLADRFLLISRGREALAGTLDQMRQTVAGGLSNVLRLQLSRRPGVAFDPQTLVARIGASATGARAELQDSAADVLILDVLLPRDSDLGPVLAAAAAIAEVRAVETRRLPLHEIYLRAVRGSGEVIAPEELTGV